MDSFVKWKTIFSSIENLLSNFGCLSEVIDLRTWHGVGFWLVVVQFFTCCGSAEVFERASGCHLQVCLELLSKIGFICQILIKILFLISKVTVHLLFELCFLIFSQHRKMLLIQIHPMQKKKMLRIIK